MVAKKETLEIPEKNQEQFMYLESMKYLVEQKESDFKAIQSKINLYKIQLSALEQRLISVESEHKQKLSLEKQNFEKEKQAKLNDLNNRLDVLQKDEANCVHRKIELAERELQAENLKEERKKIVDERIKYEQLNNQAQIKLDEANKLFGDAVQKINEASKKNNDAENILKEIKNTQSIVDKKNEDLGIKELDIKKQTVNLELLRNEITPKIEESKELITKNQNIIAEIKKKEEVLLKEIAKNEGILESIENKKRELRAKAIEVDTKQEELLRMKKVL